MEYLSSRAAETEWIGGFCFVILFSSEARTCESHGVPFGSSSRRAGRTQEGTTREAGRGFASACRRLASAPPAKGRDLVTLDQSAAT